MEGGLKYTIEICLCYRRIYKMLEIESKKLKGTYRCQFYHDHEKLIAGLDEGKNSSLIYQKSVAIKKAINDMLFQNKTEDEALEFQKDMAKRFEIKLVMLLRRQKDDIWKNRGDRYYDMFIRRRGSQNISHEKWSVRFSL